MLLVDLREFARGPVETRAELAGDDPLFEGLGAALAGPVRVTGRLQAAGEARFYWRGSLDTIVATECRRCLRAVSVAAPGGGRRGRVPGWRAGVGAGGRCRWPVAGRGGPLRSRCRGLLSVGTAGSNSSRTAGRRSISVASRANG